MLAKELSIYRKGIIPMLIVIQLLVLSPLWFELPLWISAVTFTILVIRYITYRYQTKLPSWLVLLMVIAAFAGVYWQFRAISGRDAGVGLISLMYAFKLLESKSYRDAALVLFISFFVMVMAFLFNQSIAMGLYLVIAMAAILFGLIALNSIRGIEGVKHLGKLSISTLLQALPIMLLLFFLFPRLPGPLWAMPDSSQAGTGISDSMSPGDIGSLNAFDDPAFRVKFQGEAPNANQMYWRGMVFADFDGYTWRQGARSPMRSNFPKTKQINYQYQVQMEPNKQRWIFGLEQLAEPPNNIYLFNDLTWRRPQKIYQQYSYKAQAVSLDYQGETLEGFKRQLNLRLPAIGGQRTKDWASQAVKKSSSTSEFVQQVLVRINQQNYRYTLTPFVLEEEVIDGFWFDTQEGFCEHYSSAFVFIMRAAGIPARVVTGYQGGEYNPYGDYYLVKQSDAHAWAEVWIDNQGWVRVDPTASIHPSRVEADLRNRANRRDSWLEDKAIGFELPQGFLSKLQMRWDAVKSFWDDTLMSYGQEQQNDWLAKLGIKSDRWRFLGYGLLATMLLSGLVFGLWLLRHSHSRDPIEKYYERLKVKLSKQGLEPLVTQGPQALLQQIKKERPDLYPKYSVALKIYIKLRYRSDNPPKDLVVRFKRQLQRL